MHNFAENTNSCHNNHHQKEEVSGAILINFALKIKSSRPPCSSEEEEFDDDYIVSKPTSTEFDAAFPPPNPSKTSPLATGTDKGRVSDGVI